jgi:hypothetical protein
MTYIQLAQPASALGAFARAEQVARTPYDTYLAHLLAGATLERLGRRADAMTAFRDALRAVSASTVGGVCAGALSVRDRRAR